MNLKIVAVVLLFAVAIGAALAFTFVQGGLEYRTFPELAGTGYAGQRVKMKVQVVAIEATGETTVFHAIDLAPDATDAKAAPDNRARGRGKVIYKGAEPQGFKLGCHATLEGRFDSGQGAFIATSMQTQCPSKYEGQEVPKVPVSGTP